MGVKNKLGDIRLELKFKKVKEFAEFLEINKDQLSRYENNQVQPSADILFKIYKKIIILKPDIHIENLLYEDQE